jgi:uncharacterized protein (TIGR00369 family)
MPDFNPPDPNFVTHVRSSFAKQQLMKTLDAKLIKIEAGEVHIELPYDLAWTQQNRHLHAGIITAIVDNACGYAAYTLMPAVSEVTAVEFKINFLAPAKGERFIAIGKVIKAGRTLTVCQGEVMACEKGEEKLIATMQSTLMEIVKKLKQK